MTALSKSCKAPDTISLADALLPFTNIANGICVSTAFLEVLYILLCFAICDFVVTITSLFGTNKLQILTASPSKPPGFPLKSRII